MSRVMICRLAEYCNKKCDKYCSLIAGHNLAKFLRETDMLESRIGDMVDGSMGRSKYIISGMQVNTMENPSHILSDISVTLDRTTKFEGADRAGIRALNDYINSLKPADGDDLKNKMRLLERSKLLLVPIKPNDTCEVYNRTGENIDSMESTVVQSIKWINNQETGELEYHIITNLFDADYKRVKIKVEDYGEKIRLANVERSIRGDTRMVKMTRFGFIKPVMIDVDSGDIQSIIIDNTYMYQVGRMGLSVMAFWNKHGLKGNKRFEKFISSSAYKDIRNGIEYISKHRRFVAPYGLTDNNHVTL